MTAGRIFLALGVAIGVVAPLQAQMPTPGGYQVYGSTGYYAPDPYGGIYAANPALAPMMRQPQAPQERQETAMPPVTANQGVNTALPHPMNPDFSRYAPQKFGHVARPQLIATAARGAGIRAGFTDEATRILAQLRQPEITQRLDRKFDFQILLIEGRIVPPVISELSDVRQAKGERTISLTVGSFEIVRPARLVIEAPNWRDYLIAPGESMLAEQETMPRDGGEKALWDENYKSGFDVGVSEAQAATSLGFERLARDYAGMQRYRELASTGAVSLPKVTTARRALRISADGTRAAIQEKTIRLVVSPKFQARRVAAYGSEP